ncbi:LytR/AlgR family response regulator transcription factor [Dinghuibacter silviterrae]|uniref:LytTR family two component transcriptional regulator n=1 Tax=Dinghuibacter silviterrae TaxID=1539049 RepID=A0A4R8DM64_9BACT|nr:LytTR family DNA-binding domain-containing protein [Dinghuibacter silviterrae]TDW99051.1 LytTR family two component transcriptional regulator [Dinghuibacter silviterrae]
MITCIAVDDEPMALEVIERYCAKSELVDLKAVFREPIKAVEYLGREKTDLVFLDINMPDISGMQLVQTLSPRPMIIFTTAYSHYAVESYNLNAVDYLLKPITFERFLASVNKAITALPARDYDRNIFIKSGPQTYQVSLREILYLEKDGNYINLYLKDRTILIRESMGDIFDLVPASDFVRVHKSYVVAIKHIAMIEAYQLTVNGKKIPIGATYRESLRSRLGIS